MHISEGILSLPVLAGGGALTAIGVALGLRKINGDNLPKVAVLTATFFIASFIHINVGPSTVHFMLNGVVGILLGWAAFPVVMIGLLIQAILFQYGGLTTLGINTLNVAGPGVLFAFIFHKMIMSDNLIKCSIGSFLAGALALGATAALVVLDLLLTDPIQYRAVAGAVMLAHIPVMLIEGVVALMCVRFFKKVKPEILYSVLESPTIPDNSTPQSPINDDQQPEAKGKEPQK